ncbi:MAG: energy-coupling factor ABC transporter ATP-binding protein [Oscillospiraceae bacterium]|jgi:cobalt/nickel transport system ATP-binding protein
MIELENVSYAYEGALALDSINFKIEKGESLCLLGPNGSGKSTLLKLINGLIFATAGSYKFDGEEITQKKLKDVKFSKRFHQRLGFVFQDSEAQLFCSNVYDEIAFGPRQMGMDEQAVEKRVNDCLALLRLESFKSRQPYHLSGGEKKKVAIAATLALNPEVLILDEPMNGLDPRTERWLAAFIVDLNRAGKTVITSTHNLELVQEISHRAILFDESHRVAADLPTEKLLEDIDLLKRVNLVDEFYHVHEDHGHEMFHIHNY